MFNVLEIAIHLLQKLLSFLRHLFYQNEDIVFDLIDHFLLYGRVDC